MAVERLSFVAYENMLTELPGRFELSSLPIGLINSDGSQLELPEMFASLVGPEIDHLAWSPDGRFLAFDGATSFTPYAVEGGIYQYAFRLADLQEGTMVPIVPNDGEYRFFRSLGAPSWSPDSKRLVVAYAMGASESSKAANRLLSIDVVSGDQTQLTDGEHLDMQPAWSPNGQWIAFLRFEEGLSRRECGDHPQENLGCVHADVYLVRPDGSDLRLLLPRAYAYSPVSGWDNVYHAPQWSPDATELLVLVGEDQPDLAIVDVFAGTTRILAPDPGRDYHPTWSPDGTRIAFASERTQDPEIYILNPEDGSLNRLTNRRGRDTLPVWSSSGRQIAFLSAREFGPQTCLFLMSDDGSNERQLVQDYVLTRPAWLPAGH